MYIVEYLSLFSIWHLLDTCVDTKTSEEPAATFLAAGQTTAPLHPPLTFRGYILIIKANKMHCCSTLFW